MLLSLLSYPVIARRLFSTGDTISLPIYSSPVPVEVSNTFSLSCFCTAAFNNAVKWPSIKTSYPWYLLLYQWIARGKASLLRNAPQLQLYRAVFPGGLAAIGLHHITPNRCRPRKAVYIAAVAALKMAGVDVMVWRCDAYMNLCIAIVNNLVWLKDRLICHKVNEVTGDNRSLVLSMSSNCPYHNQIRDYRRLRYHILPDS